MGGNPRASVFIEQVVIRLNETLTIYFYQGNPLRPDLVQLEARVNEEGTIELFCDESIRIHPFSEWTPLEADI